MLLTLPTYDWVQADKIALTLQYSILTIIIYTPNLILVRLTNRQFAAQVIWPNFSYEFLYYGPQLRECQKCKECIKNTKMAKIEVAGIKEQGYTTVWIFERVRAFV